MPQNNAQSTLELMGSINLTDLAYVQVQKDPSGTDWLMIPVQANPALFLSFDRKNGAPKVSLDLGIWRSPNNQYGNTHYIRTSVGSKNAQGLTEEQRRAASIIVGNLKPPKNREQAPAAPAGYGATGYPQGGPYPQPGTQPAYAQGPAPAGYQQGPAPAPQGGPQPMYQQGTYRPGNGAVIPPPGPTDDLP